MPVGAASRRSLVGPLIVVVTLGVVISPALVGSNVFGVDYINHLWLVGYQGKAIANTGFPTLFVHTGDVFEPFYGFYGGTLYAVGGYLTVLFGGNPDAAYIATILIGLAMAYGGMWWLGRLLGLAGWVAHAPAVVAVTSPYLLTDLYARGAWPEFMALCSIPLMVAGPVALLRQQKWHAREFAAFLFAVVIFTGSHNITLLWGTVILGALALLLLTVLRRRLTWRRAAQVLGVAVLGVGINAWFLALDLRHGSQTVAAHGTIPWSFTSEFNTVQFLFDPLRRTPKRSGTLGLAVAAPVFGLAWAVVVGALHFRKAKQLDRRLWLILAGLIVAVLACVLSRGFWSFVGSPFDKLQFPYRLNGYVLFLCAGLVLLTIRMHPGRNALVGLAVVLALSIIPGAWQIWHIGDKPSTTSKTIDQAFANGLGVKPPTWYDGGYYADFSQPLVSPAPTRLAIVPAPPPGTSQDNVQVVIPPGQGPVALNIEGGPYVVGLAGASRLGRTAAGRVVVAEPASATPRTVTLKISRAGGTTLTLAPIVTGFSLVIAVVLCFGLAFRRRRAEARVPAHRHGMSFVDSR